MNQHEQWFDGIASYLIRHAAAKAPAALAERLGEEWLADLSARSGTLSQLRFALGCCWATNVIAREFGVPVRAAAAAAASKTTAVDEAGSPPTFSRRTTVILVIVGLHVLVICVLATAIEAPKVFRPDPQRMDASVLPKPTAPVPATPADPTFSGVTINPPEPQAPVFPTEPTVTTRVGTTEPIGPAVPPLPVTVKRVVGGPGAGFPNADDFYPAEEIRRHEMGIATIGVCVDGAGRLIGTPTIEQSSGRVRLDEAAVKLAKAGSGHYRATTDDGHPVSACYGFNVRFRLRD